MDFTSEPEIRKSRGGLDAESVPARIPFQELVQEDASATPDVENPLPRGTKEV